MSIETEVAALTTATTTLTGGVSDVLLEVDAQVALFAAVTNRVNNELNNVDNTADIDKEVSNAVQLVIDALQGELIDGFNISTINGQSLLSGIPLVVERSATSLASLAYEDRGTLRNVPVLPSVVDDSIIIEHLGLFLFVDTDNEPDSDEMVFTTAAGQWIMKTPHPDWIAANRFYADALLTQYNQKEELRFLAFLNKQQGI